MKQKLSILIDGKLIFKYLVQNKDNDFDELWKLLKAGFIIGYITADQMGELLANLENPFDDEVADEKFERVMEVLEEYRQHSIDKILTEDAERFEGFSHKKAVENVCSILELYRLYYIEKHWEEETRKSLERLFAKNTSGKFVAVLAASNESPNQRRNFSQFLTYLLAVALLTAEVVHSSRNQSSFSQIASQNEEDLEVNPQPIEAEVAIAPEMHRDQSSASDLNSNNSVSTPSEHSSSTEAAEVNTLEQNSSDGDRPSLDESNAQIVMVPSLPNSEANTQENTEQQSKSIESEDDGILLAQISIYSNKKRNLNSHTQYAKAVLEQFRSEQFRLRRADTSEIAVHMDNQLRVAQIRVAEPMFLHRAPMPRFILKFLRFNKPILNESHREETPAISSSLIVDMTKLVLNANSTSTISTSENFSTNDQLSNLTQTTTENFSDSLTGMQNKALVQGNIALNEDSIIGNTNAAQNDFDVQINNEASALITPTNFSDSNNITNFSNDFIQSSLIGASHDSTANNYLASNTQQNHIGLNITLPLPYGSEIS